LCAIAVKPTSQLLRLHDRYLLTFSIPKAFLNIRKQSLPQMRPTMGVAAGEISPERVANAIGARQLVLVLDNCEHVIDAAAQVAQVLLRADPAIRVLATSREPLRTEGEYLYRVPPLAVPAQGIDVGDELLRYGAVELFLSRARAADPHLSLDGDTAGVVAAICRHLDGIPLAIELAATRGAALGITDLAFCGWTTGSIC
jgi:predicted ATPase